MLCFEVVHREVRFLSEVQCVVLGCVEVQCVVLVCVVLQSVERYCTLHWASRYRETHLEKEKTPSEKYQYAGTVLSLMRHT